MENFLLQLTLQRSQKQGIARWLAGLLLAGWLAGSLVRSLARLGP